jgi:hypothetical protein
LRLLLAAVVLSAIMFASACGQTRSASDPFVGTWRMAGKQDVSTKLVIAKVADAYRAFLVNPSEPAYGPILYRRHGNRLVAKLHNGPYRWLSTYTYHSSTRRLTYRESGVVFDLQLISRSTAHPQPSTGSPSTYQTTGEE